MNNLCTYYKSTDYITFDGVPYIPSTGYTGSMSFNPNRVSATNAQHTFGANYAINAGDYIKIVYYPQVEIPDICSITSGNGICYSYPLEDTILIKANTSSSSNYQFTLGGMTNLYQSKVSDLPYTQIWDAASGTIRARFTTYFWVNHIQTDPTTSDALSFSFTPTLTPNYQLKYGFSNIARVQISHLMQNQLIKMIYVTVNWQIEFVNTYCNATLESTTAEALPYPYRFECQVAGDHALYLYPQDNFPDWQTSFTDKNIVIYLKYTIHDSKSGNSNAWNAHAYTITSVNSEYRVSQASGTFPIDEFQSPYIYKVNFPTEAFSKRTCRINELCMFYGYLLPSTQYATTQLRYMVYTLPQEFGYSKNTDYDKCQMQEKNDDNNPITCTASRSDSDVSIKFNPTSYNHNYKLVSIDTTDQTQLFQAPKFPGTHYQMKVDLYTSTDILMESMMVNLTTVYGDLLEYPQIHIEIPKDADSIGLFEFKFRVGDIDILPSHQNSANSKVTSAIELQFSKSFEFDIGTDKMFGDEVACLGISGMSFSTTGKLTCRIFPSVSTTTYPKIIVTGFDRILKQTDVIFRIAGLKTLPEGVQDYIKIGVSLTYYDYGQVKGFIYEPTGFVVGNTTAAITPISITPLTLTEQSTNFVGDLVNYTFAGTLGSGFANIKITDYVAIEFEKDTFEGYFSLNSEAVCSIAAGSACLSFGISNIVYFQPASEISSSTLNFALNQVINTAYSFEYVDIDFKVFTLVDNKVDASGTVSLTKFSKPSPNISAIITKIDSRYGGDSGINYYFQFSLNSNLPRDGVVLMEVPDVYKSLFDLNSKCLLRRALLIGPAYCKIVNSHIVAIYPNGQLFDSEMAYQFILTNITNPNIDLSNEKFVISSFHSSDIYQKLIIARNTFDSPDISLRAVKSCETFEVELTAVNAFFDSQYEITLICPSYIKEASELKIYLSWQPETKKGKCSSDSDALYSQECNILNEFEGT